MNLYMVTGTTKGLGKALADALEKAPDCELITLARAPGAAHPKGLRIEVDLADSTALEKAFDRIDAHIRGKRYARAVLINNAGVVSPVGPLERIDGEELERNLAVNLVAPMRLMRRFLLAAEPLADVCRIINISSGAGRRPIFGWSAYCAAKAGLDMASQVVALEAQKRSRAVEVVSLAPGVIDTDMQATVRGASPDDFADLPRFQALKAEGTLRLASDVAADILRAEREGRLKGGPVLDLRALVE